MTYFFCLFGIVCLRDNLIYIFDFPEERMMYKFERSFHLCHFSLRFL